MTDEATKRDGIDRLAQPGASLRLAWTNPEDETMAARALKAAPAPLPDPLAEKKAALSQALRRIMTERGIKQADIARLCFGVMKDEDGFPRARNADAVSCYVAGTRYPEASRLAQMAKALNVTLAELTGDAPEAPPPAPGTRSIRFDQGEDGRGRLIVDAEVDAATYAKIVQLLYTT